MEKSHHVTLLLDTGDIGSLYMIDLGFIKDG